MLWKISRVRQIKPGEGAVTALMISYIIGVMSFYYILKPLRSALFLRDLPAKDLPNAYLLTALLAGPLVALVFKFSRRLSVVVFMTCTNLGVIGSLLLLRWAIAVQFRFLPYAYFTYVQIISVLCVAQFWLLAGYLYDGRQAKRIYSLLGTGALIGSIVGSLLTDWLKAESVTTMLGICILICAALVVLVHVLWRYRRTDVIRTEQSRRSEPPVRSLDLLRVVFESRLLRLLVLLVFLTMIASQIADWQVDYVAQESFSHLPKQQMEQEIKSFRARFNWVTNLIGIVLQLTLTRFVLQRAGTWAAILFLPAGLGFAAIGILFAPSLGSVAVALGCDSVFRYSINRAGLELLVLPLSPGTRKRVKLFIDVFVDRIGRAAAAFIILMLTTRFLPIGLTGTATIVVGLTAASMVVGWKLRSCYVDAFRRQLARQEVDLSEVSRFITDPASLRLLASTLGSPNERQILYALGLLQSAREFDFSDRLLPLLQHRSSFVREEAARTLHALPGNHETDAQLLLRDESEGVRNAAIEYLCMHESGGTGERLRGLLEDANPDIRLAAGRCAANLPDSVYQPSMDSICALMLLDGTRTAQAHEVAALLAARLPGAESVPFLRRLLHDSRRQVAAGAIKASGRAGRRELVGDIVPFLSDRSLRSAARQALASMGMSITADLSAVLSDEGRDPFVRMEIPWILSQIQDARAARILVENLSSQDIRVKYQVVKALNRIHSRNPDLPGSHVVVEVHLIAQIMAYYEGLALFCAVRQGRSGAGAGLVGKALREHLDRQLEIVFRLLGLSYPQRDIYSAYVALKGLHKEKRISAIEFLDNILKRDVKSLILPLLEEEVPERLVARIAPLFNLRMPGRRDALLALMLQSEPWLRACALYEVGSEPANDWAPHCLKLLLDPDPRVRETADWALNLISPRNAEGRPSC